MITYFVVIKQEHRITDITLGFLFLAITLRLLKSVFYYVFDGVSALGVAFGFLGFASIGPLLYFYFKFSKNQPYKLKLKDVAHFVFAIFGFLFIVTIDDFRNDFYLAAKFQMAGYLVLVGYNYFFTKDENKLSRWHVALYAAMICLLAILTFQFYVGNMTSYTIGTAMASLIIYVLFFIALKTPSVIKKGAPNNLPKDLLDKIKYAIETDRIYTQPSITLTQFSEAINTPTYLVSKATKVLYNKSFPEAINSFRIKDIAQKLAEPNHGNDKIEDLAYDVGFNTSSAFYNAFKKETAMTPRAYQKMIQNKVLHS
jgi:AraC-like DNA-binding protein